MNSLRRNPIGCSLRFPIFCLRSAHDFPSSTVVGKSTVSDPDLRPSTLGAFLREFTFGHATTRRVGPPGGAHPAHAAPARQRRARVRTSNRCSARYTNSGVVLRSRRWSSGWYLVEEGLSA